ERELRQRPVGRRPEQEGEEQRRTRRRLPCPPLAAAAGGLEVRESDRTLRHRRVEQRLRGLAGLDLDPGVAELHARTGSTRTAETLYSGVPISGRPHAAKEP